MSEQTLSPAEVAVWRELIAAIDAWLDHKTWPIGAKLERAGRRAFKTRCPPPWERADLEFWRGLVRAAERLDEPALRENLDWARGRLDALDPPPAPAPPEPPAEPYYLKD